MPRLVAPTGGRWESLAVVAGIVLGLSVAAAGLWLNRPWQQEIWSDIGWRRLSMAAAGFALAWAAMHRLRVPVIPVLLSLCAFATAIVAGPVAPMVVAYFLLSSWALGRLLTRVNGNSAFVEELLYLLLGMGVWQTVFGLLAHFPVNSWPVYVLLLALPLAVQPRSLHAAFGPVSRALQRASSTPSSFGLATLSFLLIAHWATAMRPEVSADGLAMHLVIPMAVAQNGHWWYDVERYSWSVMPMASDWAYTAVFVPGGEWAARTLNFALLALIVTLMISLAARWLPVAAAALLTGLFAATPVVHLVTGNLFVENFQALMLLGACAALLQAREQRGHHWVPVAGALLGVALSTKFGSLAYAVPIVCVSLPIVRSAPWRETAKAIGLLVVLALPPYVTAYALTGNPVFPFLNGIFQSPQFDTTASFRDERFVSPLTWRTLYDATFHTSRFLEAQDGALGLQYLVLAPVCVVGVIIARGRLRIGAALLVVAIAGAALTWSTTSNVRYWYAAMPLFVLAFASVMGSLRVRTASLYRLLLGICFILTVFGALMLSASGWWKDFLLNPFDEDEKQRYLATFAPGRLLVNFLNTQQPNRPVLFLVNGQSAGLRGRVYLNSWHNETFYRRLRVAQSAGEALALLASEGIELLVIPTSARMAELPNPVLRSLVANCTAVEYEVNGYAVASIDRSCRAG